MDLSDLQGPPVTKARLVTKVLRGRKGKQGTQGIVATKAPVETRDLSALKDHQELTG